MPSSILTRRIKYALIIIIQALAISRISAQTGIPVPEMTNSDAIITDFLRIYNIPGATVAIAKDGRIVYQRAFGYSDTKGTIATHPHNMFRIASLSKQITSIAIMKLMEQGRLSLSSTVFGAGGILETHPVFSKAKITDARIYNITVRNLLEHAAGWNRDLDCNPNPSTPYPYFQGGCDPISFPLRVTQLTGTTNPVTRPALITFLIEKGLDFAPGTSYNYSNIGYLMLGEVIEKITGLPYENYIKDSILAPLGIFDMHIAKNLLSEKREREGEYTGNGYTTLSMYGNGQIVPWEYGGFNVNAMDAHGGWIASSRDMLKLLTAVDGFSTKPDILQPSTLNVMTTPSANNQNYAKGWAVNSANNWWHTGSLDGTASEWVRSGTGYTWIIILNKRNITSSSFWSALDNLGWRCLAATSTWPSWDLMASPTQNAKSLSLSNTTGNSITVNWVNGNGSQRLLLVRSDSNVSAFPVDGTDYTGNPAVGLGSSLGANNYVVYNGTGNSATITNLTPGKRYYFRVVEYNKNAVTGNNALYLLGNNPETNLALESALPTTLTWFKVNLLSANRVKLDWQSVQEINSDFTEIERGSDGNSFSAIGKMSAKGNSSQAVNYSFTDNLPLSGKNFYRLKMVDKDGKFTYSTIELADNSGSVRYAVTVNHSRNELTISQSASNAGNTLMIIRDISGRSLSRQNISNASTQTVKVPAMQTGVYFITFYAGQAVHSERIVVK